ncbi:MAG: Fe-S-containing hydro-lyase [Deinococcota bacterium]|jgi:fumarate hydratase subunit beta|nr:Fe-S-containing hydro-lyase [Deinococcota bacterium]
MKIAAPFDEDTILSLKAGDLVEISGRFITARDAAHKRLVETLARGEALPVSVEGEVIYYVGPAPAKPGQPVGSAGPTTSGRMDPYTVPLLEQGVKGLIGKGYRSKEVREALVEYRAVYLAAVGGAAALLAQRITSSRVIAYEDLGSEAIHEFLVENFPAVVVNDIYGGDAYASGRLKHLEGAS